MDALPAAVREALKKMPPAKNKKCVFGKYPRHGSVARRGGDCVVECPHFPNCSTPSVEAKNDT